VWEVADVVKNFEAVLESAQATADTIGEDEEESAHAVVIRGHIVAARAFLDRKKTQLGLKR
jgi:hypothetical protein